MVKEVKVLNLYHLHHHHLHCLLHHSLHAHSAPSPPPRSPRDCCNVSSIGRFFCRLRTIGLCGSVVKRRRCSNGHLAGQRPPPPCTGQRRSLPDGFKFPVFSRGRPQGGRRPPPHPSLRELSLLLFCCCACLHMPATLLFFMTVRCFQPQHTAMV